jgi:hypothetical protein
LILPLLFWNGATICPYYVTPFGLLGLNGRKKLKKKKCLEEKIVMPLALSPSPSWILEKKCDTTRDVGM